MSEVFRYSAPYGILGLAVCYKYFAALPLGYISIDAFTTGGRNMINRRWNPRIWTHRGIPILKRVEQKNIKINPYRTDDVLVDIGGMR